MGWRLRSEIKVMSLTNNEKHLLRLLTQNGAGEWHNVSKPIWPLIADLPSSLVEINSMNGTARLTDEGKIVVKWLL